MHAVPGQAGAPEVKVYCAERDAFVVALKTTSGRYVCTGCGRFVAVVA